MRPLNVVKKILRVPVDVLGVISVFSLKKIFTHYNINQLPGTRNVLSMMNVHPTLRTRPNELFCVSPDIRTVPTPHYVKKDKVVVYTCITNNYDTPIPPIPAYSSCDFILFTDNPDLLVQGWKTVAIQNTTGIDSAKFSRMPKILPHRFLKDYDVSIYVDGNVGIHGDILSLLHYLKGKPMAAFKHPDRDCLYDEARIVVSRNLDNEGVVSEQIQKYKEEGFPDNFGLTENRVMIREHYDPSVMETMEMWWRELLRHSKRDQLSFPYVLWKTGLAVSLVERKIEDTNLFVVDYHSQQVSQNANES